jgi:hypothetical protein
MNQTQNKTKFWIKKANDAFNILTNKLEYKVQKTGKNLDNKTLKGIYQVFYTSYYFLIQNQKINKNIIDELSLKKNIIDKLFQKNIKSLNRNNANLMKYKSYANTSPGVAGVRNNVNLSRPNLHYA